MSEVPLWFGIRRRLNQSLALQKVAVVEGGMEVLMHVDETPNLRPYSPIPDC